MLVVLTHVGGLQVCKYFLDAIEKEQYGWFWVCPNGGAKCMYRHALPPGYIFKTRRERELDKLLEMNKQDATSIEQIIEEEVRCVPFSCTCLPAWLQYVCVCVWVVCSCLACCASLVYSPCHYHCCFAARQVAQHRTNAGDVGDVHQMEGGSTKEEGGCPGCRLGRSEEAQGQASWCWKCVISLAQWHTLPCLAVCRCS